MSDGYVLVTGGAGFIGTNLAARLANEGKQVMVFDNLSRDGVSWNLDWLLKTFPDKVRFVRGDVRDARQVSEVVHKAQAVFHLAAQVAVTTSLIDPVHDFEVNARGTLNVLEAIRSQSTPPFLLYTSTNKVLGGLEDLTLRRAGQRYEPVDSAIREHGLGEDWGIEFCSPYGCSKGSADQYVLDYSRCFGLPAVVFRMSCIFGPHQCGNEDQGWVAHFVRQILENKPITFYGDGMQIRDALYVEDLIDAFKLAEARISGTRGQAFNLGGGPERAVSLIELVRMIGRLNGSVPEILKETWRPSDQRYYVSDTRKFNDQTGWVARTSVEQGISNLYNWMKSDGNERGLLKQPLEEPAYELRARSA